MERLWSYEAPEGISSEISGGNKKLFGGEQNFCGGVKDNMRFRSIALITRGFMRSSSQYRPRGAPIFPRIARLLLLAYEQSLWDRTTLSVPI